uniref:Tetratricopeptide repeat protein 38 n=1 Tax=Tetraselmis chuii TaxID=63592 RepID=A0A7S1X6B0_9CHLO|mmetsp:Transcript_32751/g.58676  ORF Transcript_32751/g.58676 Transcript_32751/m.58676 type:complete len:605 (+) Transcript_32751:236-2050(+)
MLEKQCRVRVRAGVVAALLCLVAPVAWSRVLPNDISGEFQPDMAAYSMRISTKAPAAQAAFDLGLNMAFNFNQPLAREAFQRCVAADPECAMCHWGVAYAFGPFINAARKPPEQLRAGRNAALIAVQLLNGANSAKELGLVRAMVARYPEEPTDAIPLETYVAYESELQALLLELPEFDADVAVLLAESKMDIQCDDDGYHFFDVQGNWTVRSREAVTLLQRALDARPAEQPHPMAAHLMIHITEGGNPRLDPQQGGTALGLPAALALAASMTGSQANHLQHMPAHTLMRTGRYAQAVAASLQAVESDKEYLQAGVVPYGPGHNLAVGVLAASMAGMWGEAERMGDRMWEVFLAAPDRPDGPGGDYAWSLPMTTPLRLGLFEEALQAGESGMPPPRDWPYAWVLYHYTQGCALLALGQAHEGASHLSQLDALLRGLSEHQESFGEVAHLVLSAAVEVHLHHDTDAAVDRLRSAVGVEAAWGYTEPPNWHQPIADCLGQVLLDAGRAQEAADAFLDSLDDFLEGPFALWGLRAALAADPSIKVPHGAAEDLDERVAAAWASADVPLLNACPALHSDSASPSPGALLKLDSFSPIGQRQTLKGVSQ